MVVVHSATKGLAAMTLAIAHSRGWLDYEERVAAYWTSPCASSSRIRPVCSRSMNQSIGAWSRTLIGWLR
jgi:hypothetical protein